MTIYTSNFNEDGARLPSLAFCDFWPGFDPARNAFNDALIDIVRPACKGETPDILIYSDFGQKHRKVAGDQTTKIHFSGENTPPDFSQCDYGIGCDYIDFGDRYLRFPYYGLGLSSLDKALRPRSVESFLATRPNFCAYIASNAGWAAPERRDFVRALHRLMPVVSAGRHLRNHTRLDKIVPMGTGTERKLQFLDSFRFSIAFENSAHPGYTTEKILDAFRAGTVPIYWGDPRVTQEFNPDAIVDVRSYQSLEDAARAVIDLDSNPAELAEKLKAPVFRDGRDIVAEHHVSLHRFLESIASSPSQERRRRPRQGRARMIEADGRGLGTRLRLVVERLKVEWSERTM